MGMSPRPGSVIFSGGMVPGWVLPFKTWIGYFVSSTWKGMISSRQFIATGYRRLVTPKGSE